MIVDCRSVYLSSLPLQLPHFTTKALFSNHNITRLLPGAFNKCIHLRTIDLSHGKLSEISAYAFLTLENLQSLLLNRNVIDFSRTDHVPNETFLPLKKLEHLAIEFNTINGSYLDRFDLFSSLIKLNFLRIDLPEIITLSWKCYWMNALVRLEIYGNLKYISNETFAVLNSSNISYLGAHSKKLEDVEPMAFTHFSQLHALNLSHNQPLGFSNVSKSWYGLRFTRIQQLDLTDISPYNDKLITIERSFFNYLHWTNITEFIIDSNNILTIERGILEALPNLQRLSAQNNRLCLVYYTLYDVLQLKHLRYFNANFQLKRLMKREASNLRDIAVRHYYNSKFSVSSLSKALGNHSNQKLSIITESLMSLFDEPRKRNRRGSTFAFPNKFLEEVLIVPLPPCLEELHMAQIVNQQFFVTNKLFFLGRSRLRILNYSDNGITSLSGAAYFAIPPHKLITIDLSKNECSNISRKFFQFSCRYYEKLYLSKNSLAQQLSSDANGTFFEPCTQLTLLDLADNGIRNLPSDIFIKLNKLQYINLSSNYLRSFEVDILQMFHLTMLDISSNLIGFLNIDMMKMIDEILTRSNLTIDLIHNPLICDCNSLSFLHWASKNRRYLRNYEDYECFFYSSFDENESKAVLKQFRLLDNDVLPHLVIKCAAREWILYSTTSLAVCILILSFSVVIYRHRWEIRYKLMQFHHSHRNYRRQLQEQVRERYKYAAFVSFDSQDLEWVMENLVKEIASLQCPLYVYTEQFIAGETIEENICRGLNSSRHTLLILSRHFVASQWCLFEARMAFQKCMDTGFDSIITVLLEDIPDDEMPPEVKRYLKNYIYLRWPANGVVEEKEEFWNKLARELDNINFHLAPAHRPVP